MATTELQNKSFPIADVARVVKRFVKELHFLLSYCNLKNLSHVLKYAYKQPDNMLVTTFIKSKNVKCTNDNTLIEAKKG